MTKCLLYTYSRYIFKAREKTLELTDITHRNFQLQSFRSFIREYLLLFHRCLLTSNC